MTNRNIEVMTSSKTMDWITPQEFVDDLPFDFDVDVCATKKTAKARFFISPETNALEVPWTARELWSKAPQHRVLRRRTKETTVCWMNPPYGRNLEQWIAKAQAELEALIVCLIPNRTETRWFYRVWDQASLICFVGRRIKFEHPDAAVSQGAPFGSVLAVFGHLGSQTVAESYAEGLSRIGAVLLPGYGNLWLHAEKEQSDE